MNVEFIDLDAYIESR
ncbi:hypothetical protein [Barnesiella intestinihominis]|nr:hypothetical protein [Barnesiella intestinihominis]